VEWKNELYQICDPAAGIRPEDRSDYVGRSVLRSASFSMVDGDRPRGIRTFCSNVAFLTSFVLSVSFVVTKEIAVFTTKNTEFTEECLQCIAIKEPEFVPSIRTAQRSASESVAKF